MSGQSPSMPRRRGALRLRPQATLEGTQVLMSPRSNLTLAPYEVSDNDSEEDGVPPPPEPPLADF
eukprot:9315681-Karenia_brevis.AAC.1